MPAKVYYDEDDQPVAPELAAKVKHWMLLHLEEFSSCAALAEEAADEFNLLGGGDDDVDIPDWIFDMAVDVTPEDECTRVIAPPLHTVRGRCSLSSSK